MLIVTDLDCITRLSLQIKRFNDPCWHDRIQSVSNQIFEVSAKDNGSINNLSLLCAVFEGREKNIREETLDELIKSDKVPNCPAICVQLAGICR